MKIIGEKINGTRSQVKKAVAERDTAFIQTLAQNQVAGGANWLDVNAGTPPEREPDDLIWLIQTVQAAVDVPLCLDSANPLALAAGIKEVKHSPLINSLSGEKKRLEGILPLVSQSQCSVIALALDDKGIPASVEDRLSVIRFLAGELHKVGVTDDRIYVDPLVMTIASNTESGRIAFDTMRAVRAEFPNAHLTCGLSNISFGLPVRTIINQAFLTLALAAGLDTAIMDPMDRDLRKALLAADVVLGRDRHCLNYTRAYRSGLLEHQAKT
jgi:cobalamin-dependent methionine synthase I